MARKASEEQNNSQNSSEEAPLEVQAEVQADAPIPGTIFVRNRTATKIGMTLADGTHIEMGPKASGHNLSRVFAKKLLPPNARRLEREGHIDIVDAVSGGAK